MKQAVIYYKNQLAGLLSEDEEGYHFVYDEDYLALPQAKPISLTLPLQAAPYHSKVLTNKRKNSNCYLPAICQNTSHLARVY